MSGAVPAAGIPRKDEAEPMDAKKSRRLLIGIAIAYWAFALMIFLVAGEQFRQTPVAGDTLSPVSVVGEIVEGTEVRQRLAHLSLME